MKTFTKIITAGALTGTALLAYARYGEICGKINVKTYEIKVKGYEFKGKIKVSHFTDVHLGRYIGLNRLCNVVDSINAQNPDIVVFTGDLIDSVNPIKESPMKIANLLSKINAKYGKYAVMGNHEYRGKRESIYKNIMEKAGFIILKNYGAEVSNTPIEIIGIDDMLEGNGNVKWAFKDAKTFKYNIALCHEPDFADVIKNKNCDFIFSGHSHGGQVQIPFYGPLLLPKAAGKYYGGIYKLNEQTTLFTNCGIGVTKLPFRFCSKPSIGSITFNFI